MTAPLIEIPDALKGRLTVDLETAAETLGISASSYRRGFREEQLPGKRLGRRIVVPVHLLLEVIGLTASDLRERP